MERPTIDLQGLLPKAIAWAQREEANGLRKGRELSVMGMDLARAVGVVNPEWTRVVVDSALPRPTDPDLVLAIEQTGLFSQGMTGLTLGYAIFLVRGYDADRRLLSHELRHVQQYESFGNIAGFLSVIFNKWKPSGMNMRPSN